MKPEFKTLRKIKLGNAFSCRENHSLFDVGAEILDSGFTGIPVVDRENRVIGIVSELDILRGLRGPLRLEEIKVKEVMARSPMVIEKETTLEEASKIMEDVHIHRLPVVSEGRLIGTLTRHDLIRAWAGMSAGL